MKRPQHRRTTRARRAVPLLLTAAVIAGVPALPAYAGDEPSEPPVLVAKDDRYTMYAGVALYRLEVYENDPALNQYDVGAADQELDRAPGVTKKEVRVKDSGTIVLKLDPKRTTDVVFSYRLIDYETGALSNWATVTIKILRNIPLKFEALGNGRLKASNKNAARADCIWWKAGDWRVLGQGPVKGKGSRILKLKVPSIKITCTVGKKYQAITNDERVRVRL